MTEGKFRCFCVCCLDYHRRNNFSSLSLSLSPLSPRSLVRRSFVRRAQRLTSVEGAIHRFLLDGTQTIDRSNMQRASFYGAPVVALFVFVKHHDSPLPGGRIFCWEQPASHTRRTYSRKSLVGEPKTLVCMHSTTFPFSHTTEFWFERWRGDMIAAALQVVITCVRQQKVGAGPFVTSFKLRFRPTVNRRVADL